MVPWWGWALIGFIGLWSLVLIAFVIMLVIIIRNES